MELLARRGIEEDGGGKFSCSPTRTRAPAHSGEGGGRGGSLKRQKNISSQNGLADSAKSVRDPFAPSIPRLTKGPPPPPSPLTRTSHPHPSPSPLTLTPRLSPSPLTPSLRCGTPHLSPSPRTLHPHPHPAHPSGRCSCILPLTSYFLPLTPVGDAR